jgi:hypothetical protein
VGSRGAALVLAVAAALVSAAPAAGSPTAVGPGGTILVNGAPLFPIALLKGPPLNGSTPWGTGALDETVAAGVTVFSTGPLGHDWTENDLTDAKAWNGAAAARGVQTWVNLRELARAQPGTNQETRLREVVGALRGSPGLGFWMGPDEPLLAGLSANHLRHAYSTTKALDPAHLAILIQAPRGLPADLAPFASVTDVHSVDVYPVKYLRPEADLHWVGRWTKTLLDVTPNRAVVTTLQICASGSFDRGGGTGAYVLPTKQQARFMAYDAILNGARGLVFYGGQNLACQTLEDRAFGWNWTYWRDVLGPLVRELGPRSRLHAALVAPGNGIGLRSSDTRTHVVTRRVGRELWVLAARRGPGVVQVRFKGLPQRVRRASVFGEGRTVRVRKGVLADHFGQWDVHVYRVRL